MDANPAAQSPAHAWGSATALGLAQAWEAPRSVVSDRKAPRGSVCVGGRGGGPGPTASQRPGPAFPADALGRRQGRSGKRESVLPESRPTRGCPAAAAREGRDALQTPRPRSSTRTRGAAPARAERGPHHLTRGGGGGRPSPGRLGGQHGRAPRPRGPLERDSAVTLPAFPGPGARAGGLGAGPGAAHPPGWERRAGGGAWRAGGGAWPAAVSLRRGPGHGSLVRPERSARRGEDCGGVTMLCRAACR